MLLVLMLMGRFRTLLFWVYEPMETLRPRLDRRVDNMVSNGLLQEIEELRQIAVKLYGSAHPKNLHEGIFQAIGQFQCAKRRIPCFGAHSRLQRVC